jgi:hypothetical protein
MKRLTPLLLILLSIFSLALPASAQEPGTPEDNACNPGGLMEGDCTSEWHWECGYYLARWQANGGWRTLPFFPNWCAPAVLLPPQPTVTVDDTCEVATFSGNLISQLGGDTDTYTVNFPAGAVVVYDITVTGHHLSFSYRDTAGHDIRIINDQPPGNYAGSYTLPVDIVQFDIWNNNTATSTYTFSVIVCDE